MQQKTIWIAVTALVLVALITVFYFSPSTPAGTTTTDSTATSTPTANTTAGTGNATSPPGAVGKKAVAVTTGFASVTSTTAIVVGTVIPEGSETTYWFQYGPTLDLGSSTEVFVTPAGTTAVGAAAYLKGLLPSTQYYFRIAAKNAAGIVYSGPHSLITSAK